jgi:hypothetical protein
MKRILVLGDSLSLPREKPEPCAYDDTWPRLLAQEYVVHQVSIAGGTIRDFYRQLPYYLSFKPDYVIMQIGIVDCAPRALSQFELMFLEKFSLSRRYILPVIKKYSVKLRSIRKISYTKPDAFVAILTKIKRLLPTTTFVSIGILPTSEEYEQIVPGVTESRAFFNTILRREFGLTFISVDDLDRKGIMSDHIHLNRIGQAEVYRKLKAFLNSDNA